VTPETRRRVEERMAQVEKGVADWRELLKESLREYRELLIECMRKWEEHGRSLSALVGSLSPQKHTIPEKEEKGERGMRSRGALRPS
jgi:hypothetical protein